MFHIYNSDGTEQATTASEQQALQWLALWPRAAWITEIVTTQKIVAIKEDYAKDIQYVHATGEPEKSKTHAPGQEVRAIFLLLEIVSPSRHVAQLSWHVKI